MQPLVLFHPPNLIPSEVGYAYIALDVLQSKLTGKRGTGDCVQPLFCVPELPSISRQLVNLST